jgi:hypothetical protein
MNAWPVWTTVAVSRIVMDSLPWYNMHASGLPFRQQSTYIMSFQRVLLCFLASCLCLHWGQAKVAGAAYPAVASLPSCGYQSVMAHIHDPDLNLQSNPKPSHVQAM